MASAGSIPKLIENLDLLYKAKPGLTFRCAGDPLIRQFSNLILWRLVEVTGIFKDGRFLCG